MAADKSATTKAPRARLSALACALAVVHGGAACAPFHLERAAGPRLDTASTRAPDFSLTSHTGRVVALHDALRAGPVIVVFYRGQWCPWCKEQLGEIAHEYASITERGAIVVAVSVDPHEDSVAFARAYDLPFDLLEDKGGAVSAKYVGLDVTGYSMPGVFVIGADGTLVLRHLGKNASDRVHSPALLAALAGAPGARTLPAGGRRGGFAPEERAQLRLDLGAGTSSDAVGSAPSVLSGSVGLSALAPLGARALIGPEVRFSGAPHAVDTNLAVKVRALFLDGLDELYLAPSGGLTVPLERAEGVGWNVGAKLGDQLLLRPSWGVYLQGGPTFARTYGARDTSTLRFTIDVGTTWAF
ncbi:MAG: peroxiredoxin family protein [Myxococcales bacterium]|nr:peroxiredoxin family protein [Myxococcales bacterium]MBL0197937.1 peroxiredoxin family protein [Myxococcales bacterium]HQY63833.1 peroxiredoxin family protein [Polyangiaceae bacterium]